MNIKMNKFITKHLVIYLLYLGIHLLLFVILHNFLLFVFVLC
jgi:hypothetical protein